MGKHHIIYTILEVLFYFFWGCYLHIYIYTHCHYSLKQPWASLPSSSALLCWKSTHSRCFSKGPTQKVDKEMQAWHNFQRCVCSHIFCHLCSEHVKFMFFSVSLFQANSAQVWIWALWRVKRGAEFRKRFGRTLMKLRRSCWEASIDVESRCTWKIKTPHEMKALESVRGIVLDR